MSSRWEARLRAHTARIRQIQAQSSDNQESPPPSPKLSASIGSGAADEAKAEETLIEQELNGKGKGRGRHTITEGMVKSESPSLFSRLFRKRAKTRAPIPQYNSVRSLRKPSPMTADIQVPSMGGSMIDIPSASPSSPLTSSISTPHRGSASSSAACTNCVPSPRPKRSFLREEKKLDDKEERSRGKRGSKYVID